MDPWRGHGPDLDNTLGQARSDKARPDKAAWAPHGLQGTRSRWCCYWFDPTIRSASLLSQPEGQVRDDALLFVWLVAQVMYHRRIQLLQARIASRLARTWCLQRHGETAWSGAALLRGQRCLEGLVPYVQRCFEGRK